MLKKSLLSVIIVFTLCAVAFDCEQKSKPLVLPPSDKICSVVVMNGNVITSHTDEDWIVHFMTAVLDAEPTTLQSVQDVPDVEHYVKIDIMDAVNTNTYFFYRKKENYYLEQPYQGIYKTNASLVHLLMA